MLYNCLRKKASNTDSSMLETPIAFFIFNRPDLTNRVFEEIASVKPVRLLVVADGPRSEEETERCAAARAVINRIEWPCEVMVNFSDANLGCKRRLSSGLDWVFEHCKEAIILEDDCLPHPSFFRFCVELLEKYRHDERVMMVSGTNLQSGRRPSEYSYYFSRYGHVWGWACWRRAWRYYDVDMALWPWLRRTSWLRKTLGDRPASVYYRDIFDRVFAGVIDTWDYQWIFTCWTRGGVSITPSVNLVSNIGFGGSAHHTKEADSVFARRPAGEMVFPLRHPPSAVPDMEADHLTFEQQIPRKQRRLIGPLRRTVSAWLPAPVRMAITWLRGSHGSRHMWFL